MDRARLTSLLALVPLVAACTSMPARLSPGGPLPTAVSEPQRTLVVAGGREPESLASKPLRELGGAGVPRTALRAFNAGLALNDARNLSHPYLAEALPELDTNDWQVASDGTMETTYHLRLALAWHDGVALTADDFVFAWQVYATPDLGVAASVPLNYIREVAAPDDRTVIISWLRPYVDAGDVQAADLPPLPRHLLDQPFAQQDPNAFAALPFWTTDYVGAGPYRLTRWEPGAFIESEGFAAHALGSPKIDHLRLIFINDSNAAVAALLAGTADLATNDSLDVDQAVELDRQWAVSHGGIVLRSLVGVRYAALQLRPAYASPAALLDVSVRRALAHAVDRQAMADTFTDGQGTAADTMVLPMVDYFAAVQAAIATYPLDVRQTEQLLREAGWTKGPDGIFASQSGERFALEVAVAEGGRNNNEVAVMADGLRHAGFDTSIRVVPRAQITDRQMRATLPGILDASYLRAFLPPTEQLRASQIPGPENRWQGSNQPGWSHPDFERLVQAYETSLDRSQRTQDAVEMLELISEEVPVIPLYYSVSFMAHVASLSGPMTNVSDDLAHWNLPDWSWTQ